MDYSCPLCESELKGKRLKKVPLPGELSALALRWHLTCPQCGGALQENSHEIEKNIYPSLMLFVAALNMFSYFTGIKGSITTVITIIVLMIAAAYGVKFFLVPKDWRRYVPWQGEKV